jgi:hypothetical protein
MAVALCSLALCNPGFRKIVARTGTISAFGVSINLSDLQSVRASVKTRELQIENDVKSIYARTLRDSGLAAEFLRLMRQVEFIFKSNGVDLTAKIPRDAVRTGFCRAGAGAGDAVRWERPCR